MHTHNLQFGRVSTINKHQIPEFVNAECGSLAEEEKVERRGAAALNFCEPSDFNGNVDAQLN
jgi:hypothetical protein